MDQIGHILRDGARALVEDGLAAAMRRLAPLADPGTPAAELCNLLADAAYQRRDYGTAETFARAAVAEADGVAEHNTLGNVLCAQGRTAEAVAAFQAALRAAPAHPVVQLNLGTAWLRAGRFAEAEGPLRCALDGLPDAVAPTINLSLVLNGMGRARDAANLLEGATRRLPREAALAFNLGNARKALDDLDGADAAYRAALAIDPDHAAAWCNLAVVAAERGNRDAAETAYRAAIARDPDLAEAYAGLADLAEPGSESAITRRRALLETKPDLAQIRSDMLMSMQYLDGITTAELAAAHREFGRVHERPALWPDHSGHDFDPDRRLRIGIVSGHFRFHAMAFLCLPALAGHDRAEVALHCYSTHAKSDAFTAEIRAAAAAWRDVQHLDDAAVADAVRRDGIDILIDLSGHTPRNRVPAFALRPAPLQVAWGDYVHTRGLAAIDYLIADRHHIHPTDERHYVEQIARLPQDYVAYRAPDYAPAVAPAPVATNGYVTFGSFNEATKIQPVTVALWSRVLQAVPTARLLINNHMVDAPRAARLRALFAAAGITGDRLAFAAGGPHPRFLDDYRQIDVMLDTTPYSGGLTTCEALWQGVPVVSLTGERFCGRHSTAHLTTAGCAEWVADTPDRFVAIAAALAADPGKLAATRATLRHRVAASPLADTAGLSRALFTLLRDLWRARCAVAHRTLATAC